MASKILESDKLYLFLLSDVTQIDHSEYLEYVETTTEKIFCIVEEMCKLLIYFDIKGYHQFFSP